MQVLSLPRPEIRFGNLIINESHLQGRILREAGLRFIKVTNETENHNGLIYSTGKIVDPNELQYGTTDAVGGIHFVEINYLGDVLRNGNGYREVTFDDDEHIIVTWCYNLKARTVILGPKKYIKDFSEEDWLYATKSVCWADTAVFIDFLQSQHSENKEIWKNIVQTYPGGFEYAPQIIRDDFEICKIAVANNPRNIIYCGAGICNDRGLWYSAVSQCGDLFIIMHKDYQSDEEIIKAAVISSPQILDYLAKNKIVANSEIIMAAIKHNVIAMKFLSYSRPDYEEYCLYAIEYHPNSPYFMHESIINKLEFCEKALRIDFRIFKFLPETMQKNSTLAKLWKNLKNGKM